MRRVFSTVAWQLRVIAHLVALQPLVTTLSIAVGLVGHVAYILAFLLPLKVILLAGSGGVPRYFRPFVDPNDKETAVIVLAVGAVFFYMLAVYCDGVLKKLSTTGSQRVLANSNSVSIVNNQSEEASSVFLRFTQLCSGSLFVVLVFGVLAWLNPILFACLAVGMLGSFLYLTRGMTPGDGIERGAHRSIANSMSVLTTLTFFVCFAVVLMPFVLSLPGRNIIVAIISFVLLRRVLGILPKLVKQSIRLAAERPLISALVFPHHQLPRHERGAGRSFREAFEKPARVGLVRAALERAGLIGEGAALDVTWIDRETRDYQGFEVRVSTPGQESTRLLLMRALSPGREFLAENERFLFENLSPEVLNAAPLVAEFTEADFDCLISDVGIIGGDPVPGEEVVDGLLENSWTVDPGANLTKAYCTSHQLLGERITENLVVRAGIAIDDDGEAEIFASFLHLLPRLRRRLRAMPLYVFNPHLEPGQIYVRGDGQPAVTSWGRWSLEPVGAVLPAGDTTKALAERLERVRQARPSLPEGFDVSHLRLAADAFLLEHQLDKGMFKRALSTMTDLIASPQMSDASMGSPTVEEAKPRPARKSRRRDPEARRGRGLPLAVEGEG